MWIACLLTCFLVCVTLSTSSINTYGDEQHTSTSSATSALVVNSKGARSKLQIGVKLRVPNCTQKSKKGDMLHVHYVGYFENGTMFDSSVRASGSDERAEPLTFRLGSGQVIKGWDQGLIGMCEGEKRKLVIPSELAYGSVGAPPRIPPDTTLTFDVQLERIERRKKDE